MAVRKDHKESIQCFGTSIGVDLRSERESLGPSGGGKTNG